MTKTFNFNVTKNDGNRVENECENDGKFEIAGMLMLLAVF